MNTLSYFLHNQQTILLGMMLFPPTLASAQMMTFQVLSQKEGVEPEVVALAPLRSSFQDKEG